MSGLRSEVSGVRCQVPGVWCQVPGALRLGSLEVSSAARGLCWGELAICRIVATSGEILSVHGFLVAQLQPSTRLIVPGS